MQTRLTGEVRDIYTLLITGAMVLRVHDRMAVTLDTETVLRWGQPGPLPAELLVPYPADEMQACSFCDAAKSSGIEPHASMAEPIPPLGGSSSGRGSPPASHRRPSWRLSQIPSWATEAMACERIGW